MSRPDLTFCKKSSLLLEGSRIDRCTKQPLHTTKLDNTNTTAIPISFSLAWVVGITLNLGSCTRGLRDSAQYLGCPLLNKATSQRSELRRLLGRKSFEEQMNSKHSQIVPFKEWKQSNDERLYFSDITNDLRLTN